MRTEPSSNGQPQSTTVRILLADNCPLVRKGLREMIGQVRDWTVCGEAGSAEEAVRAMTTLKPDLTVMDLNFPDSRGVQPLMRARGGHYSGAILVLTAMREALYAELALKAGAGGFITKDQPAEQVMIAIQKVLAGEIYLDSEMSSTVLSRMVGARATPPGDSVESLSVREMQVFEFTGQGLGTREIAQRLHLSIKTVECHKDKIKKKLSLRDTGQLYRQAVLWCEHHIAEP